MSRRRIALATAAFALAAAPALAAPSNTFELTASNPTAKWDGPPQTTHGAPVYDHDARVALGCATPLRPCDDTLLKVAEAGKLQVKVDPGPDLNETTDVDLYIYKSDAEGAEGDELGSSAANGPDAVTVKVTPGYYLARADYYHAENGGYTGEAKLMGVAPPPAAAPVTVTAAPAPAAPAAPATTTAKKPSKRAACVKKAKRIKNAKKRKAALKRCKKR